LGEVQVDRDKVAIVILNHISLVGVGHKQIVSLQIPRDAVFRYDPDKVHAFEPLSNFLIFREAASNVRLRSYHPQFSIPIHQRDELHIVAE
jgi:hypothetical protein